MLSRAQALSLSASRRRPTLRFRDDPGRDAEGGFGLVLVALMALALVLALLSV